MDSVASSFFGLASALCAALRIRLWWKGDGVFCASQSIVLAGGLLVAVSVLTIHFFFDSVSTTSALLLFFSALSCALHDKDGFTCKYTPMVSSVCVLVRLLVAESTPVYVVFGIAVYVATAVWNALPRKRVELTESSRFIEEALKESWWPIFVVASDAKIKITSGGVETKGRIVEVDPALRDGTVQIRTKVSNPDVVVFNLQRAFMHGVF